MNKDDIGSDLTPGIPDGSLPVVEPSNSLGSEHSVRTDAPAASFQNDVDQNSSDNAADDNRTNKPSPQTVRIVRDDNPSDFETHTLRFGRYGLALSCITLIVACVTGYFFYGQFQEMANQTDLLGRAAKQARIDAKDARMAAKEQIGVFQQQVDAAQNSASAIQRQTIEQERPWIAIYVTPAKDQPFAFSKETGGKLALAATVSNVGHSVAEEVTIWSKLRFEPTFRPDLREQVCSPEKAPPDMASDYVLFPGESQPATIYATATAEEAHKAVNDVTWSIMDVVVCVNYKGVLDPKLRQTRKIFDVVRPDLPNKVLMPNFWPNHTYTNEVALSPRLKGNFAN